MFKRIVRYPSSEFEYLIETRKNFFDNIREKVARIIEDVKNRGDEALRDSLVKYHKLPRETPLTLDRSILEKSVKKVSHDFINVIEQMANNLEQLMKAMKPKDIEINFTTHRSGVVWRPLSSVGVYVPGGQASYPSTAVMNIIPAKVANVERIYVATPPKEGGLPDLHTLATLSILGVDDVFIIGGAEAVAAFTYGTETVPRVDKIVGPGGIWFTAAKALVSSVVGIDILAGPTELVVVADESALPEIVAWDLAAQAEHSPDTLPVLVVTDIKLLNSIIKELEVLVKQTPRGKIIQSSFQNNGIAVIVDDHDKAVDVVNAIAPEHVHISTREPSNLLSKIRNAGAVTVGLLTPSSFPDYFAGVNHVLPTGSWARFRGGLSVLDFMKPIYYTEIGCRGLHKYSDLTRIVASVEELWAHFGSFDARLKKRLCSNEKK